ALSQKKPKLHSFLLFNFHFFFYETSPHGKRITSSIDFFPSSTITRRSTPNAFPPLGGIVLSASKSPSSIPISSFPILARIARSPSNRFRCSSGLTNSEKALQSSTPLIYSSNRSAHSASHPTLCPAASQKWTSRPSIFSFTPQVCGSFFASAA